VISKWGGSKEVLVDSSAFRADSGTAKSIKVDGASVCNQLTIGTMGGCRDLNSTSVTLP